MKQCDICGHAAERGSICHHCRAAIKRARDQTVSQFQAVPALAGGAGDAGEGRVRRTAKLRVARPAHHSRKSADRSPVSRTQGSGLLEVPPATRSAPFVWVILTLMVFVVTYVGYRVITTASEVSPEAGVSAPAAPSDAASPAGEPAAQAVGGTPAPQPQGSLAAVALPAQSDAVEQPVQARQLEQAPNAQATAGEPRVGRAPPAARDKRLPARSREAPPRPTEEVTSARAVQNVATTTPDTIPVADSRTPKVALATAAPSPVRVREPSGIDHWQRMASAIRGCGGKGFLDGLLCEQKVRIEYCEGWWGKAPECPNGVTDDHG